MYQPLLNRNLVANKKFNISCSDLKLNSLKEVLAKIFVKKILRLKVEERLICHQIHVIYLTLKQTPLI